MSNHEGQTRTAMARCPSIIAKKKCKKITKALIKPPINQCETLVGLKKRTPEFPNLEILKRTPFDCSSQTRRGRFAKIHQDHDPRKDLTVRCPPSLGQTQSFQKAPCPQEAKKVLREGEYFGLQTKKGCKMLQQTSC